MPSLHGEQVRRRLPMDSTTHWVGTWAASPAPSEAGVGFNNHTLRMNPRVSIGGDTIRVRISNACGSGKLEIGAACVGIRDKGPAIIPGSERVLTFSGSRSVSGFTSSWTGSLTTSAPAATDLTVSL